MKIDITFNKVGELWEAEFEATADFALHIERSDVGTIQLFQNTSSSNGYAIVEDFRFDNRNKLVIDYDTPVLIPKRIKIVSEVLPTYAAITTDGEITEIKSQAKVVEISSNGTTSVEPDAGFSYLSKVDVKVDVATSGEGGGDTGGSSDEWKYYNIEDIDIVRKGVWGSLSAVAKFNTTSGMVIMPPLASYLDNISTTPIAVAINTSVRIINEDMNMLLGEVITNYYLPIDTLVTEITEEEFYNLES